MEGTDTIVGSMTTVAQLLLERAGDDGTGLRDGDASWSWRQVVEESAAWASWLRRVRREGPFHIGVLLENVPEYLVPSGGGGIEPVPPWWGSTRPVAGPSSPPTSATPTARCSSPTRSSAD